MAGHDHVHGACGQHHAGARRSKAVPGRQSGVEHATVELEEVRCADGGRAGAALFLLLHAKAAS